MLKRTHVALGLAVAFYFMPHIKTNKFVFLAIVLFASLLPDLESGFSAPRRNKLFSLIPSGTYFHKNRMFHTYSFLIPVAIVLAFFYPALAFPFFLGYSFHLFIDSFTPQGIRPFWPMKARSTGRIVPGGKIDLVLFYVFVVLDFALFFKLFV